MVRGGVLGFVFLCNGAIARCRMFAIWMYAFMIGEPKVRVALGWHLRCDRMWSRSSAVC